jgi:DNA-binding XRE family transcriptional regulator
MSAEWFAGRLKELREQAGLTQGQLAERCGVNRFSIAQLEQGRYKPTWESVLALANGLGISCEAFAQAPSASPKRRPGRPPRDKTKGHAPAPVKPRSSKAKQK